MEWNLLWKTWGERKKESMWSRENTGFSEVEKASKETSKRETCLRKKNGFEEQASPVLDATLDLVLLWICFVNHMKLLPRTILTCSISYCARKFRSIKLHISDKHMHEWHCNWLQNLVKVQKQMVRDTQPLYFRAAALEVNPIFSVALQLSPVIPAFFKWNDLRASQFLRNFRWLVASGSTKECSVQNRAFNLSD